MAWRTPETAPPLGRFLAKFKSKSDREQIVVLERHQGMNKVIGVGGGLFEFDLGTMLGWHPMPEGLE